MFNNNSYPQKWSEMSTDLKLMMGFHLSMMVLSVTGAAVGVVAKLAIAGSLLTGAIVISVRRKLTARWRWPGVALKEIAVALVTVALVGGFAFAATPLASPNSPVMLPWFLAVAGIGIFWTANALRFVTLSEADFLAQCGEAPAVPESAPAEARWRGFARSAYTVAFIAVWLVGVASFYLFGVGMRDGTAAPTMTNTAPLTNHGDTVYVTAAAKHLIEVLQTSMFVGTPVVLIVGAILHFVLKIPVFGLSGIKRN